VINLKAKAKRKERERGRNEKERGKEKRKIRKEERKGRTRGKAITRSSESLVSRPRYHKCNGEFSRVGFISHYYEAFLGIVSMEDITFTLTSIWYMWI
jgi:hypothetical protein